MTYATVTVDVQMADSIVEVTPELSTIVRSANYEEYGGPFEVTPANAIQTLATAARVLTENIIIHPIPEYYGLITWDGSTLTVS